MARYAQVASARNESGNLYPQTEAYRPQLDAYVSEIQWTSACMRMPDQWVRKSKFCDPHLGVEADNASD
jgi:hypothetical protein